MLSYYSLLEDSATLRPPPPPEVIGIFLTCGEWMLVSD